MRGGHLCIRNTLPKCFCVPGADRGLVNTTRSPDRQSRHTSVYWIAGPQGSSFILLGRGLVRAWLSLESYGGALNLGRACVGITLEDPRLTTQR